MKRREIYGEWPNPKFVPNLPDNIEWQNMGISAQGRFFRVFLSTILALVVIIGALLALVSINSNKESYYEGRNKLVTSFDCPAVLTKKLAYEDYLRDEESEGIMHCLCFDRIIKKGIFDYIDVSF